MIFAHLSPRAQVDLAEIHHHIAIDNPHAAARMRETILTTADFLARYP
jgi:plasmid stabilization system protein ParE